MEYRLQAVRPLVASEKKTEESEKKKREAKERKEREVEKKVLPPVKPQGPFKSSEEVITEGEEEEEGR